MRRQAGRTRIALLAAIISALVLPVFAQEFSSPYYGKNKVVYEEFAWKSYSTEHFRIYFYAEGTGLLKNIVATAESAYRKVSAGLEYELAAPVPIIVYANHTDFEQTNLFDITEKVLGVSEPILHRIALHADLPLDELRSLVTHELAHIFEFDILWGNPAAALYALSQPPLWMFEGLSEYLTGEWPVWSLLILRDAVMNDRVPDLSDSGDLASAHRWPRDPAYDFGHALYEFMDSRFGQAAVRKFFKSLKGGSPLLGRRETLKKAFHMEPRQFSYEFKKYLRARFKDFAGRENPEDYSAPLGPEFPLNPFYSSFSHAVSPADDLVAAMTFNAKDGDIDIVILSTRDGTIVRNLTPGYSARAGSIKYEIDPSLGRSLAWSRDGGRLAFFARADRKHALVVIDALEGSLLRTIELSVDRPMSPDFCPDGRTILFAASDKGIRDIFSLDLETGKPVNLTRDALLEKAPVVSPDGRSVAYSLRVGGTDKLFLSPIGDFRSKKQLTFGRGNAIAPQFSPDGRTLYFSSDARDAFNLYSLALDSGELRRYTDVRTGNFFAAPVPGSPGAIIFSSFHKSVFQLFKSDSRGVVEQTLTFSNAGPAEASETDAPGLSFEIREDAIQPRSGIGRLSLAPRLRVGAMLSTDGAIHGGIAFAFTDILGDHSVAIAAGQARDFRSVFLSYGNQRRRFQWAVNAFRSAVYSYPDLYDIDPILWSGLDYRDSLAAQTVTGASVSASYPFSRGLRAEGSIGAFHYTGEFFDPARLGALAFSAGGYFLNGDALSAAMSITGETTRFKRYGPAAGGTFRLAFDLGLPVAEKFLRGLTLEADARRYIPLGSDVVAALRLRAFSSSGRNPRVGYYGGNNEVRSADFRSIAATRYWQAAAEVRFPLISTASTIVGAVGPVRGVLFFDITRRRFFDDPPMFHRLDPALGSPEAPYYHEFGAIGSWGGGIEIFVLGLPVHLEFAKRLEWRRFSQPFDFSSSGVFMTKFWIGYDF